MKNLSFYNFGNLKISRNANSFLNCILINARSLKNKINEFRALLFSELYDFIFVTESWLNDTVSDGILCASTVYHVFRCDRKDKIGGGVAIFCKNYLNVNTIENNDCIQNVNKNLDSFNVTDRNMTFIWQKRCVIS